MNEFKREIRDAASWWAYVARFYARQTWDDMPGPWYVKLILVVVCCAIPGPQDEILLLLFVRLCRAWRKRQGEKGLTQANLSATIGLSNQVALHSAETRGKSCG